jgi:hypothetical protein
MPTMVDGYEGQAGCAVRAAQGEEPKIVVMIKVGREAMDVLLNAHQAEQLGSAILADVKHARGGIPDQ